MYCQGRRQMKNKRINCLKWSLISAHLEAITSTSVSHLEPLSRVTGVLPASPTQGNWCPPSLSHFTGHWCPPSLSHSGELVSSQPLPLHGSLVSSQPLPLHGSLVSSQPLPLRGTGVLPASPTQGNWCPPSLSHSGELVSSQPLPLHGSLVSSQPLPLRGTGVLPASPTSRVTGVLPASPTSRVTGVLPASPTQGNWCPPSLSHSGELVSSQPLPLRGTGVLPASPTQGNWCPPSLSHSGELPFHCQHYLASSNSLYLSSTHTQCAHTCSTMPYTCLVSVLDCPTTTQGEHGDTVFTLMTTTLGIN